MQLTPGSRLYSSTCTGEVIVVKAPKHPVTLTIGGEPPVSNPDERPPEVDRPDTVAGGTGMALGKRYVDADQTLEILCTKPGAGLLAVDGASLAEKAAKSLPASD